MDPKTSDSSKSNPVQSAALAFAEILIEPVRSGVLEALKYLPAHLVPQVKADSQSSWVNVDTFPGPCFSIWRATGALYEVDEEGVVGDDPIWQPEHSKESE